MHAITVFANENKILGDYYTDLEDYDATLIGRYEDYVIELTVNEKLHIVDFHNKARKFPNPQAANMRKLYWNDALEETAKAYAETCKFEHSKSARVFNEHFHSTLGENIYVVEGKLKACHIQYRHNIQLYGNIFSQGSLILRML